MLEAVQHGDRTHLAEELGDVLLQVLFHARVAEESGGGRPSTSTTSPGLLVAKLVRRHPHVFADGDASIHPGRSRRAGSGSRPTSGARGGGAARGERGLTGSACCTAYPPTLPALLAADKVLARLARTGAPRHRNGGTSVTSSSPSSREPGRRGCRPRPSCAPPSPRSPSPSPTRPGVTASRPRTAGPASLGRGRRRRCRHGRQGAQHRRAAPSRRRATPASRRGAPAGSAGTSPRTSPGSGARSSSSRPSGRTRSAGSSSTGPRRPASGVEPCHPCDPDGCLRRGPRRRRRARHRRLRHGRRPTA